MRNPFTKNIVALYSVGFKVQRKTMYYMKLIKLFITIVLPTLVYTLKSAESPDLTSTQPSSHNTDERSKRFTLQDLLSGVQDNQLNSLAQPSIETRDEKTQSVDVQSLIAAVQAQNSRNQQEPSIERFTKPIDVDLNSDKTGNINLSDFPSLLRGVGESAGISANQGDSLQATSKQSDDSNNIVKEELNLGKEKLEIEAAGKRATHYTLVKGPDGGLNLVPVIDGAPQNNGNKFEVLQPKGGYEEKGRSRQQMQLTTLVFYFIIVIKVDGIHNQ